MDLSTFLDAADHGRLDVLRAGLDAGLDVNEADGGGWTALLTAVRASELEAVRLLLDAGADVAAERPGAFGPLHMLITAAREKALPVHVPIAAALLEAGADPNQPTASGKQTPVRNAAALGLVELLQLLLASGRAEVDARDKQKATPIFVAAESGGLQAVRALLKAGADPHLKDRYGRTPLHAAATAGDLAVARALVEAGVEVAAATRFPVDRVRAKSTAHSIATTLGHTDLAAYLVHASALADAADDSRVRSEPADWPDAQSPEAEWLRAVLRGEELIPMSREDRHVLDAVLNQCADRARRPRLQTAFRGLLIDPDPRLRAAAVHFYVKKLTEDDGAVLRAWREFLPLYSGVKSPWYPEDRDLRGLLAAALSQEAHRSEGALDAIRAEALVTGRGMSVVAGLLSADRRWLLAHVEAIVDGSPDALPVLLGSARLRGLDPAELERRLGIPHGTET